MAGGEDSSEHNENPSKPQSTPTPTPSSPPTKNASGGLAKTGEIMLGFALSIIFIVICCVVIHLLLKWNRQRYPNGRPNKKKRKKKKPDLEKGTIELHSVDKKVFEAGGTQVVLCELPEDAPPIHEMDAGEIPFPFSPIERTMTGATGMTGTTRASSLQFTPDEMVSPEDPWPEGRHLAVYWSSR